ncbi:MAG: aldehyde dehydrogenase family protein, partial [Myxococcota bacterium]|nr:aldehyde dehydrogenase family protein [Myxococcota bacterium]
MSWDGVNARNFVGGAFVDAAGRETIDNINPATGDVIGTSPRSRQADVDAAVAAAV